MLSERHPPRRPYVRVNLYIIPYGRACERGFWCPSKHQSGARDDIICSINTFAHFALALHAPDTSIRPGARRQSAGPATRRLLASTRACGNDTCIAISNTILSPGHKRNTAVCNPTYVLAPYPNATQPPAHPPARVTCRQTAAQCPLPWRRRAAHAKLRRQCCAVGIDVRVCVMNVVRKPICSHR